MNLVASFALGALLAATPAPVASPSVTAARGAVKPESIARDFVSFFQAGRFAASRRYFNEALAKVCTPEILAEQKQLLDSTVGRYQAILETQHLRGQDDLPVVQFICQHEKGQVAFRVALDRDLRVSQVYIDPVTIGVEPQLEAVARAFVADFTARKFDVAGRSFDATMQKQLTPAILAQLSRSISGRFGNWKKSSAISQRFLQDDLRSVSVINEHERGVVEVKLVFNKAGEVAGLTIGPVETTAPQQQPSVVPPPPPQLPPAH